MAKGKLRVGVVGLGIGRGHLESYRGNPLCEVIAIADLDEARLQEHGDGLQTYTDPQEMFDKANLDAVSIAVPNKFHCPLTLAALDADLHVLCEKPMAMTVAEAEEMQAKADQVGKNLMINFSYRFSPMSYALKQQIDAGVVGDIYFGRTVWHRRRGMPGFGGWFGNKALSGGGPLIDLGVHRIDLALWLMGHPTPVAVSGSAYNVIAKREAERLQKHYSVEDLAAGIIKFDNGASLIVEASWALNINEREHMITSLYGEKGGLVQKNVGGGYNFHAELYTEEGGNLYTKVLDTPLETPPRPYEEFINCIVEERQPTASGHDGIKVQKILNGLYQSAEEGREIRFD